MLLIVMLPAAGLREPRMLLRMEPGVDKIPAGDWLLQKATRETRRILFISAIICSSVRHTCDMCQVAVRARFV